MSASPDIKAWVAEDADLLARLRTSIGSAFRGKAEAVELALVALLARGHVLFEDVPGTGKTTLARSIAMSLHCPFRRIQFTSDLLPGDVLGVSIWREDTRTFELKRGPIFASIVLADEINRTTPRTQSALLEAMAETRVTIDNETHDLPTPYMVIATQNPKEMHGTYPLPESQLDRFLVRLRIGYPEQDIERDIIQRYGYHDPVSELVPVASADDVIRWSRRLEHVRVDPAVMDYVMSIVRLTRTAPQFDLGVSTRGAISLYKAAQARAYLLGRPYVVPDDVKVLVAPIFSHRVALRAHRDGGASGRDEAETVLLELVDQVPVPR